jgi:hypothetical protein
VNRSAQQPLEFSPAMLVALGLVAMIGLFGLTGSGQQQGQIERLTDQTISFEQLGVRVSPAQGWTHLSVAQRDQRINAVFVNASAHLIVRMHPFHFDTWPPTAEELLARGINTQLNDGDTLQPSLDQVDVVRKDYEHVSIDWIEVGRRRSRGAGFLVGRLQRGEVDLMVTAMTHSDTAEIDQSLSQLCDSVEFMDSSLTN